MIYLRYEIFAGLNGSVNEVGYCWPNKDFDAYPFRRNDGKEYESDKFYKISNEGISFKQDVI